MFLELGPTDHLFARHSKKQFKYCFGHSLTNFLMFDLKKHYFSLLGFYLFTGKDVSSILLLATISNLKHVLKYVISMCMKYLFYIMLPI